MPSQFGDADSWQASTLPGIPKENGKREEFLLNIVKDRNAEIANKYRNRLIEIYGNEKGSKIKYAEAFEICQYGRQPSMDELKQMFPVSR
jgi:hypothetical protein